MEEIYFSSLMKYERFLPYIILFVIFILAVWVRMLANPGDYLSGMDPYYHYRMVSYYLEHGSFPERDFFSYYPNGRDVPHTYLPFLAYTIIFTYKLITSFGLDISLMKYMIIFPAVSGAVSVVAIYLLVSEILDKRAGIIASFFMAFIPGDITRIHEGFCDKEAVAGFLGIFSLYFFVRAIKSKGRDVYVFSSLSGITLAFMALTWGGFRIIYLSLSLLLLTSFLANRLSRELLKSYSITAILTIFIPVAFFDVWSLSETLQPEIFLPIIMALISILALLYYELSERISEKNAFVSVLSIGLVLIIIGFLLVPKSPTMLIGFSKALVNKIFYGSKGLVRETVAESQSPVILRTYVSTALIEQLTSGDWWNHIGALLIFYPVGLFIIFFDLFKEFKHELLLIILWTLVATLSYQSEIRLGYSLAPVVCVTASYLFSRGISNVNDVKKLMEAELSSSKKGVKKERLKSKYDTLKSIKLVIFFIIGICAFTVVSDGTEVASGFTGEINQKWLESLLWLKENTPEDSIVISWWDYGYWIQHFAQRYTILDGANIHTEVNQDVAKMFSNPESFAKDIIAKYNPEDRPVYVLVSLEEFRKSWAISHIAQVDPYIGYSQGRWIFAPWAHDYLLVQMLPFFKGEDLNHFKLVFDNDYVWIYRYNP